MSVSISASNVTKTSCYVTLSADGTMANTIAHYSIDGSSVANYTFPTTGTITSHSGTLSYSTLSTGDHTLSCYLTRQSDGSHVSGSDCSCDLYIQGYSMEWDYPMNGQSIEGSYISISGYCTDPDGIDYIYVYIDNNYAGYCSINGTYFASNNVPVSSLTTGAHTISLMEHSLSGACHYTEDRTFYYTMARPSNWSWSYSIYSGGPMYQTTKINDTTYYGYVMTANEWNNFLSRINQFRSYKGLSNYTGFSSIVSGSSCTAAVINQAVSAINAMGFSIAQMADKQDVPASVFINMRDSLNSL